MASLARKIYPSTNAIVMNRFEQATSRLYGYLVIDLNSGTPEKDRLHTDLFENRDDEMFVDERNASDESDDDDDDDKPMVNNDLPSGRPEHQELTDHTTCLANLENQKECILRELVIYKVHRILFPRVVEDAKEQYQDCDPKLTNRNCSRNCYQIYVKWRENTSETNSC